MQQIDNSIYFNPDRLLSYNCLLSIVIGERGVGKTYSMKDYCIRHFLKQHKKFCWIRRYASDLDEAVGTSDDFKFFSAVSQKHPYKYSMTQNKKMISLYLNDRICGYATSLRAAESLKGSEYIDVDTIVLDEFLVGDGGSHYLKNEPMYLLSLIETIARFRKIRVILLGNASGSVVNPYFDFFKIHLPYNSEYQTFKNNTIVVHYIKNEKYRQAKRESEFGQLVAGTEYEQFAIENKFTKDNYTFIQKKNPKAKLFCNIIINNMFYGVWIYKNEMYISKKYNPNYGINLTFDYNLHNEKTLLLKSRSVFIENIANHYRTANLFFEDLHIKTDIIDLLRRLGKIY